MNLKSTMSSKLDVAIIGGGIIGVSCAYELAKQGLQVAVFEKGTLGCEQSSRNWGWIRVVDRHLAEVPLALRAQELWRSLQQQIDVGYRETGLLYLQENEDDHAGHQRWLESVGRETTNACLIGPDSVSRKLPSGNRKWTGALYCPTDGVAEPAYATQRIAQLAQAAGCHVFEHCAVRGIDTAAGAVSGVVTEHGRISASAVLCAGGVWSRLLCTNTGVAFPQLKVRATVFRTSPLDAGLETSVNAKDFTCRKRADGGYTVSQFNTSYVDIVPDSFRLFSQFLPTWLQNKGFVRLRFGKRFFEEMALPCRFDLDRISPFELHRVLSPEPSARAVMKGWKNLTHSFPVFLNGRVDQAWGGYIDVTPDALPVIGPANEIPGLYLASGFSGHGFGIGPAAGELIAKIINGSRHEPNARPFRLERFH
ncbi:NAD(P)/FAD-dependent oxidoreductase [Paracandidimonas soli]|uniref:NAD(P)/FAD-dependent oxidoreductase n=1 Tax=Paracandidimonas soli TaxID=1917182 RepID=UPI003341FB6B